MKIQIISDIHLEFRRENFLNLFIPSAPVLCMVGDICACGNPSDFQIFIKFLQYISPKYKCILHVAGNHEYYTAGATYKDIEKNTMSDINRKLNKLTKIFPNYHFLNNKTFTISANNKTYIFIGTTLWSYIPLELYSKIQRRMNDYNHIYIRNKEKQIRLYTVLDMQKNHKKAVSFIKTVLKHPQPNAVYILLTHHKPIFDRADSDILIYAYESNLQNTIIKPPLKIAAHGHTHIPCDKIVNKVRIVSNPKGYINERTKFNEAHYINC